VKKKLISECNSAWIAEEDAESVVTTTTTSVGQIGSGSEATGNGTGTGNGIIGNEITKSTTSSMKEGKASGWKHLNKFSSLKSKSLSYVTRKMAFFQYKLFNLSMEKNNLIPVSQDINNGMKELYDY